MEIKNMGSTLSKSLAGLTIEFKPGTKVTGKVLLIDRRSVFLDINAKGEGILNREEFLDKEGNITVKVGDPVDAYFVESTDEGITLTTKMTGQFISQHMEEAFASGIPVEGKVIAERKGGFAVKVAGEDAFCPYSQMDIRRREPEEYLGNSYFFTIAELNSHNLVVSRRGLLEQERAAKLEAFKEKLHVGDVIEGEVVNIRDFGVFVDLGACEGFIPISELSWARTEKPEDVVQLGLKVQVEVKKLDWENQKLTLSFRSAQSPWERLVEKFPVGRSMRATVVRVEPYGAFLELEKGVEAMLHISKLGAGRRITHAKEAAAIGDVFDVMVESFDDERHRISLVRDFSAGAGEKPRQQSDKPARPVLELINLAVGVTTVGIVEGVRDFGVFVRLTPEKSGLLHVSEVNKGNAGRMSLKDLTDKFPMGSPLEVTIKEMKPDGKMSLVLAGATVEDNSWRDEGFVDRSSFGSLADAFGDLKL